MAHLARARSSFDELYRQIAELPSGVTGEILEPDRVRTMSRPGRSHRLAAKRAGRDLAQFDEDSGGTGWWIEVEAEIRILDRYLVVPDLAGWRVERVPELPDENPLTVVPVWVCEVLSPTTARDDRRLKLPLYARAGVPWIWLLDVEARQLEIYETIDERATFAFAATETTSLPPFDHPFDLGAWFATTAPRARPPIKTSTARSPSKRSTPRRG